MSSKNPNSLKSDPILEAIQAEAGGVLHLKGESARGYPKYEFPTNWVNVDADILRAKGVELPPNIKKVAVAITMILKEK